MNQITKVEAFRTLLVFEMGRTRYMHWAFFHVGDTPQYQS